MMKLFSKTPLSEQLAAAQERRKAANAAMEMAYKQEPIASARKEYEEAAQELYRLEAEMNREKMLQSALGQRIVAIRPIEGHSELQVQFYNDAFDSYNAEIVLEDGSTFRCNQYQLHYVPKKS